VRARRPGLLLVLAALLVLAGRAGADTGVVRLEGQVTGVRGDAVAVSVGAAAGVQVGDEGTIVHEEAFPDGSRRKTNIARIRVTAVRPDGADTSVVVAVDRIQVGQRVSFLYRGGTTRCVGSLHVTTAPPGATVAVDGATVKGVGPMVLHGVPCGDRQVVLRLAGHAEVRRTVTIARGELQRLAVQLAPGPLAEACVGEVEVSTQPAGALVRVDGEALEPEAGARRVPCGGHVVTATLAGHDDVRERVTVTRGAREQVTLVLSARAAAAGAPGPPEAPGAAAGDPPAAVAAPAAGPERGVAAVPPADSSAAGGPSAASLVVSVFGYKSVGAVQGVLTLGLLTSQYAVEVDDRMVLGWKIRSDEATIQVPPGRHRLRVLVRNVLSRSPIALHEGEIDVRPGVTNEARVNFLISVLTVNGALEVFNRLQAR
jgi:hypothetical protein